MQADGSAFTKEANNRIERANAQKDAEMQEVRRKAELEMQTKAKETQLALEAKDKEIQHARQLAETIKQTADQAFSVANMNLSTANERASSADIERRRVEADLKTKAETAQREADQLRGQAQLADARLQAQQQFMASTTDECTAASTASSNICR